MSFTVAIVGRPNVGKSSVFNRLIGQRKSITDDQPGVTKDRIYGRSTWLTKSFGIIDTGGIDISDAPFLEQIKQQALFAVNEADLVLFIVDAQTGITDADTHIAKILYTYKKDVIVAVNKADNVNLAANIYEFYSLGFADPVAISAHHGIGFGDLLDKIVNYIPEVTNKKETASTKIAVIGYPNVGKSSLVNAILGESRVITSSIPGTTIDAVDTFFTRNEKDYVIVDTAGIKKRGQIYESTERYALLRALQATERSDVVLFLLDASREIINQDKHVAGLVSEYAKACVIVVNKWDLVQKQTKTMALYEKMVKEEFKFLPFAEVCFVSSTENKRINTIFQALEKAVTNYNKKIQTAVLNELLTDITAMVPPKPFGRLAAKFNYMTQVSIKPPTFLIFVNDPKYVHFSYTRYLENRIREAFDFTGTPIKIIYRKKEV